LKHLIHFIIDKLQVMQRMAAQRFAHRPTCSNVYLVLQDVGVAKIIIIDGQDVFVPEKQMFDLLFDLVM
jgi:hypothetical protein